MKTRKLSKGSVRNINGYKEIFNGKTWSPAELLKNVITGRHNEEKKTYRSYPLKTAC
jgi:hypothetical protein